MNLLEPLAALIGAAALGDRLPLALELMHGASALSGDFEQVLAAGNFC